MKASIQNFRGLASASLDLSKICLLAGPNEAGKTSTVQALAAALTGDPIPIRGVKKSDAGMLVRSGTANGSVELTSDNGATKIQWPAAKVKTEGQAPFASHFATGLQSIVNMDDKERVKILTEYLKATPTRADLDAQLASMNLPTVIMDNLWQLIETQGWDNACAQIKEKGARLKGQWENITGDRYGSKKAESWIPEGYEPSLEAASEDTLKACVTDARDALEAVIAANAVDDSLRMQWEELAALKPEREAAYKTAKEPLPANPELDKLVASLASARIAVANAQKDLERERQTLHALPLPDEQPTGLTCPECQAELLVQGGGLVKLAPVSEKETEVRKKAIDKQSAIFTQCNADLTAAIADRDRLEAEHRTLSDKNVSLEAERTRRIYDAEKLCKESDIAIEKLKAAEATGTPSERSVEECRNDLARCELRLKAFTSKHEADRIHGSICMNAELMAKIAPEGIRGDVLARALKGFNDSMAKFCTAAGWRPVTLESDFMPTYGGTIYLLLSESAKFRVRVILQIAMALMDKSQALIIDAADILDKGGRNGLFRVAKAVGLPVLVAMTIDSKDLVPNLAKPGLGVSYWLNGEAVAELVA